MSLNKINEKRENKIKINYKIMYSILNISSKILSINFNNISKIKFKYWILKWQENFIC